MQNIEIKGTEGEQITLECNGVKIAAVITTTGLVVDPLDGARRLIETDAYGVSSAANQYFHKDADGARVASILAPIRDNLFKALSKQQTPTKDAK